MKVKFGDSVFRSFDDDRVSYINSIEGLAALHALTQREKYGRVRKLHGSWQTKPGTYRYVFSSRRVKN